MADNVTDDRGVSVTEVNEDVFSGAFDEAAELGEKAELTPADDPEKVPAGDVIPPEEKAEDKVDDKVETKAEVKEEAVIDPTLQKPGESDEKYEQRYLTLQGIFKKDKETWEAKEAALIAQLEEAKKPPAAPAPKVEAPIPAELEDSLSEEDKAALKEYDEEFDIVSKMEGKKRDVALKALEKKFAGFVQGLRDELKAEFSTQLAPATAFVEETKAEKEKSTEKALEEAHFNAIKEQHSDFEQYRDDGSIKKWIEAKPGYLKKALLETYSKGTADDIVELLTDFKTENNIPIISAPENTTTNVVQIDAKKEAKKQAMRAVVTRKGAVNVSMSPANDFEGAFDEALSKEKQGG